MNTIYINLLTDEGCYDIIKKEEEINNCTCICDEKGNGMLLTEYFKMFEQKCPFFIDKIFL